MSQQSQDEVVLKKGKEKKKIANQQRDLEAKNAELNANNKTLGDRNKALEAQIKAYEQTVTEQGQQITQLETKAVTIITSPEDPAVQTLQKMFDLSLEHQAYKQMSEEDRSKHMLSVQKTFEDQRLDALEREMEIRSRSPEVVEASRDKTFRRSLHLAISVLGGVIALSGVGLLVWCAIHASLLPALIGIGLLGTGSLILLLGVVPYLAPEDADKVIKLAKALNIPSQFKGIKDLFKRDKPSAEVG